MTSRSRASRRTKSRKIEVGGKHTEDDEVSNTQSQSSLPSSSAWSTRTIPIQHIQPLSTFCIQVFATNLRRFGSQPGAVDSWKSRLAAVPDTIIPRVFASLRANCPTILSNELMTTVSHRRLIVWYVGALTNTSSRST